MRKVLRTELRRAVCSRGFAVAVAGFLLLAVAGVLSPMVQAIRYYHPESGYTPGHALVLILDALSADATLLVLPILCALPHTASFVEDHQSKYFRAYLPRAGRRKYIGARLLSTALSGGLVVFCGSLLLVGIFMLAFGAFEGVPLPVMGGEEFQIDYALYKQQLWADLIGRLVLLWLAGCFWACMGGLFGCLVLNKYMAYAAPFILYYVLIILEERYFTTLNMLNPKIWMDPALPGAGSVGSMALFLLELILLAGLAYGAAMVRRMKDA